MFPTQGSLLNVFFRPHLDYGDIVYDNPYSRIRNLPSISLFKHKI